MYVTWPTDSFSYLTPSYVSSLWIIKSRIFKSQGTDFLARPSSWFAYTLENITFGNFANFLIDLLPKITT